MGILDTGVRIAARFNSHCPQTSRMYYHPPPPKHEEESRLHDDHHHYNVFGLNHHRFDGVSCNSHAAAAGDASAAPPAFPKSGAAGIDSADFILYTVV
ncbi:uncharacterized protein LOC115997152 [Ipomoea triloba]|uniref:uncharacterized protein LOC115997152 n=1 Tax=Ipomoea triloba TaxID=35885 RepID=UPI00125E7530|nr:uncharacterized protein LOC115997152 [Ipomoea triloba]GMC85375.1 Pituitary adenylate cyclase-activating polypeptide type I receptor like [Ipomoea batatas]GMD29744.1 Pituitary adenylate cyclase-activating polypeptide type I receptor like [Ipomoea batatas]GMD38207.1 Pituitary adenylate cyclase-activating polypeptide type I receptor like [Ipomoea batatas]